MTAEMFLVSLQRVLESAHSSRVKSPSLVIWQLAVGQVRIRGDQCLLEGRGGPRREHIAAGYQFGVYLGASLVFHLSQMNK